MTSIAVQVWVYADAMADDARSGSRPCQVVAKADLRPAERTQLLWYRWRDAG